MPAEDRVEIPNRSLFRPPEVCEIARVPKYVLSSWEAEFPDLGVAKTAGGPRVYRRADVERVLRIKHLLFVEGLTLAGARRRLSEETATVAPDPHALEDVAELLGKNARERILQVQQGLREIAAMLSRAPSGNGGSEEFQLSGTAPARGARAEGRPPRAATARRVAKVTGGSKKK